MSKPPPPLALRERPFTKPDEVEYYNDLPGKSPPDISAIKRNHDRFPRGWYTC